MKRCIPDGSLGEVGLGLIQEGFLEEGPGLDIGHGAWYPGSSVHADLSVGSLASVSGPLPG